MTMLILILPLILFSLSSAFQRKLVLQKASCFTVGNSYLRLQAVPLIGSNAKLSQPVTIRTDGELPAILPVDEKYVVVYDMLKKVLEGKEKILGYTNLDTLVTANDLANVSVLMGKYTEAFELYKRVANRILFREQDPDTLDAFNSLVVVWSVLRMQEGFKDVDTDIYKVFGYSTHSERADFKNFYDKLHSNREIHFGNDHPDTLKTAMGYADLLFDIGYTTEPKELYETVLKAWEKRGTSSPEVLPVIDKLANILVDLEEYDEAKEMYKRALDGREQVLGTTHIDTQSTANNFANLLLHLGYFAHAKPLYESALKLYESKYGINDSETLKVVNNLATFHSRYAMESDCQDKRLSIQEATQGYSRALEGFKQVFGPGHKYYLTVLSNQAILLFQEAKMMDDAENDGRTAAGPVTAVNQTEEKG